MIRVFPVAADNNTCLQFAEATPKGEPPTTTIMQALRAPVRQVAPFGAAPRPQIRSSRATRLVVMAGQVSSNDFRNGLTVEIDSQPYKVVEFLHVKPGKGAAFVRSKLKNFLTGGVVEKTFRAGEMVNTADIQKRDGQYTYAEGDTYVFMDTETYEETRLKREEWANYLKEVGTLGVRGGRRRQGKGWRRHTPTDSALNSVLRSAAQHDKSTSRLEKALGCDSVCTAAGFLSCVTWRHGCPAGCACHRPPTRSSPLHISCKDNLSPLTQ